MSKESSQVFHDRYLSCNAPLVVVIFTGSDFDAIEDKTNALITKDPNKLSVYERGFDGHSLRAHTYFGDRMPNLIRPGNRRVFQINQDNTLYVLFEGDMVEFDPLKIKQSIIQETHLDDKSADAVTEIVVRRIISSGIRFLSGRNSRRYKQYCCFSI